ncbi:RDD family protein [Granulicella sp. 5B5]|uniref:RDD family protein n=1 Tax=Granulicella sp. 5B5 TaxID=1617967 RepID=UPI0015F77B2E|nr:RDD family protein [Granulicella sp. 5B5]QMV19306.1 RDD family protein [Granulicella sp. 5B5]
MASFESTGYSDQSSNDSPHLPTPPGAQSFDSDLLTIATPEQIDLHYNIAGLGSRFVAVLIDTLCIGIAYFALGIVAVIVAAALGRSNRLDPLTLWFYALLGILFFLIFWGYFALFEAFWHGQTPGKRTMQLRVIKDSGRQITLFESLARNLLRFVDYFPSFYLTGVITMLCNKRNKRLGDFVAGTLVVHERIEEQPLLFHSTMNLVTPANSAAEPWREQTPTMFPADAVAKLSAQDLLIIETFFSRMLDLTLETRASIAYRIAGQLTAKMGVTLPEGNPERALESIAYQMRSSGSRK